MYDNNKNSLNLFEDLKPVFNVKLGFFSFLLIIFEVGILFFLLNVFKIKLSGNIITVAAFVATCLILFLVLSIIFNVVYFTYDFLIKKKKKDWGV